MAYLAPIDTYGSEPVMLAANDAAALGRADFSPLEWSVIRLSRKDHLWTVRSAGPVRRFWNGLIGRGNPALADPRLETLRRIAVLSWHFGFVVSGDDVADFVSAGFTIDQYELMVGTVRAVLTGSKRFPS